MGALLALAQRVLGVSGAARAGRLARRAGIPIGAGIVGAGIGEAIFDGGDGLPRRRRRRRVLTANDRADIAFITATLGAPAGKSFALIVAART